MNTTVEEESKDENSRAVDLLLRDLPALNDLFDIHFKVGEGTFSSVFLATLKSRGKAKKFAIKHLIPTYSVSRVERELKCLQQIGGADNVVGIELCLRNAASVAFVMPYMRHNKFSDYLYDMGSNELKFYMRALLIALRKVHLFNIIHRDVKPSNFLYDRKNKKYLLVDFGLAQEFIEKKGSIQPSDASIKRRKRIDENSKSLLEASKGKSSGESLCYCFGKPKICSICTTKPMSNAPRAGTPGYRPPEVLLKHNYQTPAIDIWASGIIMLCIISATSPFFQCPDDGTALAGIITIFGSAKIEQCARKLGKNLIVSQNQTGFDFKTICEKLRYRTCRETGCQESSVENYPPEAYDLLNRLLDVDYTTRITADQALEHPFLKI